MAFTDTGYDPEGSGELYEDAENIHTEIDPNANVGRGTDRRAMLLTMARLLATNQEQALDELYDAGYIETAEGEHLDRRCADIGIQRKLAQPASGVVEFYRENEPTAQHVIPRGTLVETAGTDPVTFETTEQTSLGLIDGFEDGTLDSSWNGDTGSVGVVDGSAASDPNTDDGSYELRLDAVSGATVYDTSTVIGDGATARFSVYPQSNTVTDCLYFVQEGNTDSYYSVTVDAGGDVFTLNKVENGTESQLDSVSATVPTGEWLTVEVDTTVNGDTVARLFDANRDALESLSSADDTFDEGYVGVRSGDATNPKYVDTLCTLATAASIEGTQGGTETNVGPRTITSMPSAIAGIGNVENPVATGDPTRVDTSGNPLVIGTDRETDDELRERALESTAIGGAGTVPAIEQALWELDNVVSVRIFENDTLNDNTGSGGLPAVSIEIVVYGGEDAEIADRIFETVAATERLYSGAHGTSTTFTVTSETLVEDETIEWSRPPKVTIDVTLDIVVDDTYVGDTEIKRRLVEYIGGTKPDGAVVAGTGIGEDIRLDAIRDRLVGNDTGVKGISSHTLDTDGDGTDDTTSDSNGLTVLAVGDSEVARTDATDGSITLNVTEV